MSDKQYREMLTLLTARSQLDWADNNKRTAIYSDTYTTTVTAGDYVMSGKDWFRDGLLGYGMRLELPKLKKL